VATVDATGLVTAVSAGAATITATSEGKTGSTAITVTLVPVANVAVSPISASLMAGTTRQFTATTTDANNNTLTGRAVSWVSSNTSVATIDATAGLVTAVSPGGPITITATSEGKTGTASVTVTPVPVATVTVSPSAPTISVGDVLSLTTTLRDANNNVLTGRVVTWNSDAPSVASVNPTTGVVSGASPGAATITATSEGKTGTAYVNVRAVSSGAGPLRVSSRNPRYFENGDGQIVYLTGSHTWSNLQDNGTIDPPPAFDFAAYLNFLVAHGHNFTRLWTWEQAKWTAEISQDYWITPGPFMRTGPGVALDGSSVSLLGLEDDGEERGFAGPVGADQGNAFAQNSLGLLYEKGQGVPAEVVRAHMWFNLSGAQGHEPGVKNRDRAAGLMTKEQVAEAQKLARVWKPVAR